MAEQQNPPTWLMMLPLLGLGALLAYQYFAPKPPAPPVSASAPAPAPAPATVSPSDAKSRTELEKRYELENERFVAAFTNLNTAMVSLKVKGDRYLDEDGEPHELVTTDKERYLPLAPELSGVAVPADAAWSVAEASAERIRFTWAGDGVSITRTWESVLTSPSAAACQAVRASLA